jgi:hypothetical protein
MANGKLGDHPITDLLIHGRHPFPPDIEEMILEIVRLDPGRTFDGFGAKPFDWEAGKNLEEARALLRKTLENLNAKTPRIEAARQTISRKIYFPARSPEDWRRFLSDPEKHWRDGYSAKELAKSWQGANGFPPEVAKAFVESGIEIFRGLELLFAFPEHPVDLPPPGGRATRSDLFALARGGEALVAIAVEGKAAEPFGPLVWEWRKDGSEGKKARLRFICEKLDLGEKEVEGIRYQLLHRTAAAVIEAERFMAKHAVMLVHSFGRTSEGFGDYADFAQLYGIWEPKPGSIVRARRLGDRILYLGWATGKTHA